MAMLDLTDRETKYAYLDGCLAFERDMKRDEYPPPIRTEKQRRAFRAGWDAERRSNEPDLAREMRRAA